jgi:hypothetical protein
MSRISVALLMVQYLNLRQLGTVIIQTVHILSIVRTQANFFVSALFSIIHASPTILPDRSTVTPPDQWRRLFWYCTSIIVAPQ